jgi:hypothetical protein
MIKISSIKYEETEEWQQYVIDLNNNDKITIGINSTSCCNDSFGIEINNNYIDYINANIKKIICNWSKDENLFYDYTGNVTIKIITNIGDLEILCWNSSLWCSQNVMIKINKTDTYNGYYRLDVI